MHDVRHDPHWNLLIGLASPGTSGDGPEYGASGSHSPTPFPEESKRYTLVFRGVPFRDAHL